MDISSEATQCTQTASLDAYVIDRQSQRRNIFIYQQMACLFVEGILISSHRLKLLTVHCAGAQ